MGASSTISTTEPRLGNLRIQTSMYGLAVPMSWGQVRATANLVWFGNFQAQANTTTTEQGGKGGGGITQVDTKYTYTCAGIMSVGSGPVVGVPSAWRGKRRYFGEVIPEQIKTITVTALVGFGGIVNVDVSGGVFSGNIGAARYFPPGYQEPNGF